MKRPDTAAQRLEDLGRPSWAAKITELRKRQGLTQATLAQRLGVSQAAVTDWERGKNRPKVGLWTDLNEQLKFDFFKLFVGVDYPNDTRPPDSIVTKSGERFSEVSENQQLEAFIRYYDQRLLDSNLQLDRLGFARTAVLMWRMAHDPDLPTKDLEKRLQDAVEADISGRYEKTMRMLDTASPW